MSLIIIVNNDIFFPPLPPPLPSDLRRPFLPPLFDGDGGGTVSIL